MESIWAEFMGPGFEVEDLGRPASFLIPSHKLRQELAFGNAEDLLHDFLYKEFGAFTTTLVPYFGVWRSNGRKVYQDECRLYEVAFAGKERIKPLMAKLAEVAGLINEEAIYFKAGQYACLIKPKSAQT